MANKIDLFLDSGAYSAWVQGAKIAVEDYIAFVKAHQDSFALYAVLDVIGDAESTLKNQRIMEEAGLNPLPCFHFGENFKYLRDYIEQYDYIAIGGLAAMGAKPQMFDFLDQVFSTICDKDGLPRIKTHGFAVTGLRAMKRYPWFSVDSTAWLMTSRMGQMFLPHRLPNGDWDYFETMAGKTTRKIGVSSISPSAAKHDGHFSNISKQWQADAIEWLSQHGLSMGKSRFKKVQSGYELKENEKWVGAPGVGELETAHEFGGHQKAPSAKNKEYVEVVEEPGLCNDYVLRDVAAAIYFRELQDHFPAWPWKWKRPTMSTFGF